MSLVDSSERFRRVVGRYVGGVPGSLVIAIGGLHGNEPAGVFACRRVLEALEKERPEFRGTFLALAGNLPALEQGTRYIDEDLNRIWTSSRTGSPPAHGSDGTVEANQLQGLRLQIEAALDEAPGPAYFLDLHTTSASGVPFSVFGDTLPNRRLALILSAPVVLGLDEHLDGTLLNYINNLGHVAVGFEGGRHDSPSAVEGHELAIWRTLTHSGCIDQSDVRDMTRLTRSFEERVREVPRIVEIRYRHTIDENDSFQMRPGFENLKPVVDGELLAHDCRGEIRAGESGHMLMPLYQAQGNDGFFIVREVRPFWLAVAAWMRGLGLDAIVPYLPGVDPHPERPDTLVINPRIARWFVIEIFHLLGFRKQRPEDGRLVLKRRRESADRR